MSMHVCKCQRNGKDEWHIRYPGLTEQEAQEIANAINGGAVTLYRRQRKLVEDGLLNHVTDQPHPSRP